MVFAVNLPSRMSRAGRLHRQNFFDPNLFAPRNRVVVSAQSSGCRCHVRQAEAYAQMGRVGSQLPSAVVCSVLAFYPSTREAPAVDLALKLNVLAVCAVFAFVGAILLGAF
jgi:hypothetical protein